MSLNSFETLFRKSLALRLQGLGWLYGHFMKVEYKKTKSTILSMITDENSTMTPPTDHGSPAPDMQRPYRDLIRFIHSLNCDSCAVVQLADDFVQTFAGRLHYKFALQFR